MSAPDPQAAARAVAGDGGFLERPGGRGAVAVELRKLLSLRGSWVMVALGVLIPVAVAALRLGLPGEDPGVEFPTADSRLEVLGMPIMVNVVFVALGAVLTAGEWRHRTATTTFLAEPRRWRVVAAQLAVAGLVGTVTGALAAGAVRATAAVTLSLRDAPTGFGADQWATMAGVALAGGAGALIGAGAGAVLRNPALAAVVVAAGGPLVDLAAGTLSEGLGDALSIPGALERLVGDTGGPLQAAGLATLAGWAVGAAALGTYRTARADVT